MGSGESQDTVEFPKFCVPDWVLGRFYEAERAGLELTETCLPLPAEYGLALVHLPLGDMIS